jgi:hypothetical protein
VVFVCWRVLHVDVRRTRYSRLVCARIPPLVSASAPARPRPRPCSLSHYHHRTRTAAAPSPSLYHYHPHRPIWSLIASGSLSYRPPRLSIVPPLPPTPSLPLYTIGPSAPDYSRPTIRTHRIFSIGHLLSPIIHPPHIIIWATHLTTRTPSYDRAAPPMGRSFPSRSELC